MVRYANDPVRFVREVIGIEPFDYQLELLEAVRDGERRIAVRSGHGTGKSADLAWLIIWHATTRYPQRTVVTAPSRTQLVDALAAEVKLWIRQLPPVIASLFEIQVEHIYHVEEPEQSYVSFRVSKAETPEALAGVHSLGYVLLIADEASGIPEAVFETAAGSMSGHNAVTILAGNPVRTSGLFFDAFHKLRHMWRCFHWSCLTSPNVSKDYIEDIKARYGEDSNGYRVRVLGEFPLADDDSIIPYALCDAALKRDVAAIGVRPIWGLDCARKGRDRSALCSRIGNVLEPIEPAGFHADGTVKKAVVVKWWKGLDTMELVGRVKAIWDATLPSMRPSEICVDSIGLGAGVCDRLSELGLPARSVAVSETASLKDQFANLKAELWWMAREWFEKRDVNIANAEELMGELTSVNYGFTSNGKIKVESKDEVRKRTQKSPDIADAFILTFAGTAVSCSHGSANNASWLQPLRRVLKGLN